MPIFRYFSLRAFFQIKGFLKIRNIWETFEKFWKTSVSLLQIATRELSNSIAFLNFKTSLHDPHPWSSLWCIVYENQYVTLPLFYLKFFSENIILHCRLVPNVFEIQSWIRLAFLQSQHSKRLLNVIANK